MPHQVALLADLHLCPDPSCRECPFSEAVLLELFRQLEEEHALILILGDLYNLDHGHAPLAYRQTLKRSIARFPELHERLLHAPYRLVFGNHDAILRSAQIPESIQFEGSGKRLFAFHGHQFDGALKKLPAVAPTGAWLERHFLTLGLDPIAKALVRLGGLASRFRLGQSSNYQEHLLQEVDALARRQAIDFVCMGHTHRQQVLRLPSGATLLNPGASAFGEINAISLNLASGAIATMSYPGGALRWQSQPIDSIDFLETEFA